MCSIKFPNSSARMFSTHRDYNEVEIGVSRFIGIGIGILK
jgi:hypothetical protein